MCVWTRFWARRGDDQQCEKWGWADVDVFLFALGAVKLLLSFQCMLLMEQLLFVPLDEHQLEHSLLLMDMEEVVP